MQAYEEPNSKESQQLIDEFKKVQSELAELKLDCPNDALLREKHYKETFEQYNEAIAKRDEVISQLQLKLEHNRSQFDTEKARLENEIRELYDHFKKVSSQLALQDKIHDGDTSKQLQALQEKLIKMQEEKVVEKERQQIDIENLEKRFRQQLEEQVNQMKLQAVEYERVEDELSAVNQKCGMQENELAKAADQIQSLEGDMNKMVEDHEKYKSQIEDCIESIKSNHELELKKIVENYEVSTQVVQTEIENIEKLNEESMKCLTKQIEFSNGRAEALERELSELKLTNTGLTTKLEETCQQNAQHIRELEEMQEAFSNERLLNEQANERMQSLTQELTEKDNMIMLLNQVKSINSLQAISMDELKSLLRDFKQSSQNNEDLVGTLPQNQEKLLESLVQFSTTLKSDAIPKIVNDSQVDSAMSENSYSSPHSAPDSLPYDPSTSKYYNKINEQLQLLCDETATSIAQYAKPNRVAPLTYSPDFPDTPNSPSDLLKLFIDKQKQLLVSCQQCLAVICPELPAINLERWDTVCQELYTLLKDDAKSNPSFPLKELSPDIERNYQESVLKLLSKVSAELLHYYSVSQNIMAKQNESPPKEDLCNEELTLKYETLTLSFDSTTEGEVLNTTAASEEILDDFEKDETLKSTLKSSLCPNLKAILKGQTVNITDLESEIQEFIISLHARIGMLKIHSHQECTSGMLSSRLDCLVMSYILSAEQSDMYTSLKVANVADNVKVQYLLDSLQEEKNMMEELKKKLHETHGLLAGSQEQTFKLQEEKAEMDALVAKLAEQLQEVKFNKENGGQDDIKSATYEVKQDIKDKVRAYLSSKNKDKMSLEELQERISELENLLEELVVENEKAIEQHILNAQDLSQQLQAADRKIKSSRQFIEEHTAERDRELELLVDENETLRQEMKDKDNQLSSLPSLQDEVEYLEKELRDKNAIIEVEKTEKENLLHSQVATSNKIKDLREVVQNLESQLANKSKEAQDLAIQIQILHSKQEEHDSSREDTVVPHPSPAYSHSPEPRRLPHVHYAENTQGLSVAEEFDNEIGRREAWSNSHARIQQFMSKIQKMASLLENTQLISGEDTYDDFSESRDLDMTDQSELRRSMSPSSWEHALQEKFNNVECGLETVLKNNKDLEMRLKTIEKESKEENDSLQKEIDEKSEIIAEMNCQMKCQANEITKLQDNISSLEKEITLKQVALSEQRSSFEELESERNCLLKENSHHLIAMSELQARVDKFKRSDPSVENSLKDLIHKMKLELAEKESKISLHFKQNNRQKFEITELNKRLIEREEEIEKLKTLKSKVDKSFENDIKSESIMSQEIQRRDHSFIQSPSLTSLSSNLRHSSHIDAKTNSDLNKSFIHLSLENARESFEQPSLEGNNLHKSNEVVNKNNRTEDSTGNKVNNLETERDEKATQQAADKIDVTDTRLIIKQLESQAQSDQSIIESKTDQIENLKQENYRLHGINESLETKLQKIMDDAHQMKCKWSEENEQLKSDLTDYRNNLDDATKMSTKLKSDVAEANNRNVKYSQQIHDLQSEYDQTMCNLMKTNELLLNDKVEVESRLQSAQSIIKTNEQTIDKLLMDSTKNSDTSFTSTISDSSVSYQHQQIINKLRQRGLEMLSQAEIDLLDNPRVSIDKVDCNLNEESQSSSMQLEKQLSNVKRALKEEKQLRKTLQLSLEAERKETEEAREQGHVHRMKWCDVFAEKGHFESQAVRLQNNVDSLMQELQVSRKEVQTTEVELRHLKKNLQEERANFSRLSQTLNHERKLAAIHQGNFISQIQEMKSQMERENRLARTPSVPSGFDSFDGSILSAEVSDITNRWKMNHTSLLLNEQKIGQLEQTIRSLTVENQLLQVEIDKKVIVISQLEEKISSKQLQSRAQSSNNTNDIQPLLETIKRKEREVTQLKHKLVDIEQELELVIEQGSHEQVLEGLTVSGIKRINELLNYHRKQNVELFRKLFDLTQQNPGLSNQGIKATTYLPSQHLLSDISRTNVLNIPEASNSPIHRISEPKIERLLLEKRRLISYRRSLIFQKQYLIHVLRRYFDNQQKAEMKVTSISNRLQQAYELNVSLPPEMPNVTSIGRFRSYVYVVIFVNRTERRRIALRHRTQDLNQSSTGIESLQINEPRLPTHRLMTQPNMECSATGLTPPTKDNVRPTNLLRNSSSRRALFSSRELDEYVDRVDNINNIFGIPSPTPPSH